MGRQHCIVWLELLMFGIIYTSEVCEPPPVIEHSGNNASLDATFPDGTKIRYFCDILTHRQGRPMYTCENGEWTNGQDHDMVCLWKRCPEPRIDHGSYSADSLTVGNFAVFQCDEGFTLKGPTRAFCGIDQKWRYLPSCKRVRCDSPTWLRHMDRSQITHDREQYIYGNTLENTCHEGFKLVGPSIQTCEADGRWTGTTPYCQEIDCGVPNIGSGSVEYETTNYGSDALIECDKDATMEGEDYMLCLEDGWTYSYCHGACNIPHLDNGRAASSRITHGQTLTWSCNIGYVKHPVAEVTCRSGNLTETPKCTPITFGQDFSCPRGLPDGYKVIRFLDKCYIFIDVHTSYHDAKQRCEQSNWTMVNIDNNQEMEFIASVLDKLWIGKPWLGITFSDERDSWVNTDGLSISYENWAQGEGKKTWWLISWTKFEKCAVVENYDDQTWLWNDIECHTWNWVMCETNATFNVTARFF